MPTAPTTSPASASTRSTGLLTRRSIRGIGVDTLSLDPGNSQTFDVHNTLLKADHYGLENVANLGALRPKGALVSVGVIPWEEGSGGPCRLLAFYGSTGLMERGLPR